MTSLSLGEGTLRSLRASPCLRGTLVISTLIFLLVWLAPTPPPLLGLSEYAPLHTLFETFAIAVAAIIFSTSWHARIGHQEPALRLFASGFLAVALLDLAHTLSYAGMPDWISPSGPNKAIEFWLAARYTAALALLILVTGKGIWQGFVTTPGKVLLLTASYTTLLLGLILGASDWLPLFYIEGSGLTTSKIALEWGVIAIHLFTLLRLRHPSAHEKLYDPRLIAVALWLLILGELCFTLYNQVSDLFNIIGHLYKIVAYIFLYQAIVTFTIKRPYTLLSESTELLQQLTDNIHQVFWMVTADYSKALYVSPAYDKIWGRPRQRQYENPQAWMEAVHPDDLTRIIEVMQSPDGNSARTEFRIIRPDGEVRWIRNQSFPIRDAEGNILRVAGISEDITEQRESAATLSASEARLRAILMTASDGIHIVDSTGTLVDASDSFLKSIGHDETCLGHLKIWDWASGISEAEIRDSVKRLLESGESMVIESRIRHRDGHEFWAEIYVRAFRIGGEELIYSSSRDISERKQAEAERERLQSQLLQAQKMESIGQLTGGIAHDFNNILAAILGFTELLERGTANNSLTPERTRRYLDAIQNAGNRARELISQMLIFSRTHHVTHDDEIPSIPLQPMIKEGLQLLRSSMPVTIELKYRCEDERLAARIEPVQLHQILFNLVINARDAIGEYGHIDVALARRSVNDAICRACHTSFSGDYVEIAVSDNGMGMDESLLAKIFDPFFTTKAVGKGTGMGLSVIHGLVHTLGGHILVESTPGAGAKFQILLPANTPLSNACGVERLPATTTANPLAGLRVMVVDDEEAITLMLHELLTMEGAVVTEYNQPAEALASFRANPRAIDLVITDTAMPGISGLDLAIAMLQIRQDLPVLLCTGYSDRVNDEIARQHGIAGFMHKPLDINRLLAWIQEHHLRA